MAVHFLKWVKEKAPQAGGLREAGIPPFFPLSFNSL